MLGNVDRHFAKYSFVYKNIVKISQGIDGCIAPSIAIGDSIAYISGAVPFLPIQSAYVPWKEIMMHRNLLAGLVFVSFFSVFAIMAVPVSLAAEGGPETLIGKAAPDFTLKDLSGKAVSFSQFKGKPVVIEFWATWCPYCRDVLPGVEKIYKEYAPRGVEVVAISIDTKQGTVAPFLKKNGYTMPVLMDDGKTLKRFSTRIIPTVFLIDRTGVVRATFTNYGVKGQAQVEAEVVKLLEK